MPKTVSASEAKNHFGSMIMWAGQSNDDVIVEVHGEPKVVIISYDEYQRMTQMRETQRRQQLLARLECLRGEVQEQNPGATEEEATEAAAEFRDDVLDRIVGKRKSRRPGGQPL